MKTEFKEYSKEEFTQNIINPPLRCKKCVCNDVRNNLDCEDYPCRSYEREDKKNGYYIKVEDK